MKSLECRHRPSGHSKRALARKGSPSHMLTSLLTQYVNAFAKDYQQVMMRRTGVATSLLERAAATAGRDPAHAAELRNAALAYLGVTR